MAAALTKNLPNSDVDIAIKKDDDGGKEGRSQKGGRNDGRTRTIGYQQ